MSSFLFLNQPCWKTHPVWKKRWLFCHRPASHITEIAKTEWRTLQQLSETRRIAGNHWLLGGNVVRKKNPICNRNLPGLLVELRNNCGFWRKQLISEANHGIYPVLEWWGIRVRREAEKVMQPSCRMSTGQAWGGNSTELGLLQLLMASFSNKMGPQTQLTALI